LQHSSALPMNAWSVGIGRCQRQLQGVSCTVHVRTRHRLCRNIICGQSAEEPEMFCDTSIRYYATYSENEKCSSKSASLFDRWEKSFATLEKCCEVSFGWDVDACLSSIFV
jgi:hypothetical protein